MPVALAAANVALHDGSHWMALVQTPVGLEDLDALVSDDAMARLRWRWPPRIGMTAHGCGRTRRDGSRAVGCARAALVPEPEMTFSEPFAAGTPW
jgi:hypothetical protein